MSHFNDILKVISDFKLKKYNNSKGFFPKANIQLDTLIFASDKKQQNERCSDE